jgi:hypothetical protein
MLGLSGKVRFPPAALVVFLLRWLRSPNPAWLVRFKMLTPPGRPGSDNPPAVRNTAILPESPPRNQA